MCCHFTYIQVAFRVVTLHIYKSRFRVVTLHIYKSRFVPTRAFLRYLCRHQAVAIPAVPTRGKMGRG
jgi:hypothetical protein